MNKLLLLLKQAKPLKNIVVLLLGCCLLLTFNACQKDENDRIAYKGTLSESYMLTIALNGLAEPQAVLVVKDAVITVFQDLNINVGRQIDVSQPMPNYFQFSVQLSEQEVKLLQADDRIKKLVLDK